MASGRPVNPTYDRFYYANSLGVDYKREDRWLRFFGHIADRLVSDIGPRTVLDAGCAMGFVVEALRDRGVEAFGVDISDYALEQVREDIKPYCTKASVTDPFARRYDLIVCIETLEHLPADDAERAVENICAHTDDVVFSSTPDHFKEVSHVNVSPPEYWAEVFGRHGLFRDVGYDPGTYISPWAVRFRRRGDPPARIAGEYERLVWRLRRENRELRELEIERQAMLAEATARVETLEPLAGRLAAEVEMIKSTTAWRLGERLQKGVQRVMPSGTRRGRMLMSAARRLEGRSEERPSQSSSSG
jgi:hypothetical protein